MFNPMHSNDFILQETEAEEEKERDTSQQEQNEKQPITESGGEAHNHTHLKHFVQINHIKMIL